MAKKKKMKFADAVLTPEQEAFAAELQRKKDAADKAEGTYRRFRDTCKLHVFSPAMTDEIKNHLKRHTIESWDFDHAICDLCHEDCGHRCPESPDTACHYYTDEDGTLELFNGMTVNAPEGHDPNNESDDWCIFCGAPQERK